MASTGASFRIPLLVPEGVETGDGRTFEKNSLRTRDLPLPLLWQMETGEGHDGSVLVGRIDKIERTDDGLGNAIGVLDTGPYGREAERLIRERFLRGVSADLDQFEAAAVEDGDGDGDGESALLTDKPRKLRIKKARVMAATLVPRPAFQECYIELIEDAPVPMVADGIYTDRQAVETVDAITACAMIAGAIPDTPPIDWFSDPGLDHETPLTVTDEGRVFGHIAAWSTPHIGMQFDTRPPRSRSGYAYFHTGVVRTDAGDVSIGQLTLSGGHAALDADVLNAIKHYDDSASAVADIRVGEDNYGIWAAGALRPGVTADQIRALRASAPSGDWRPINGRLELVAVCQVNVPGFPIARARVASGYITALVAAGAGVLAERRLEDDAARAGTALRAAAARTRINAALLDLPDEVTLFRDYSDETRQKYAKKGWALPDGSYPISNVADLRKAIQAYGRSATADRVKVRRHIMKRARGLGRADLIPTSWKSASIEERHADISSVLHDMVSSMRVAELSARVHGSSLTTAQFKPNAKFDPSVHPRDDRGKFRDVLFRLKETISEGGEAGEQAQQAVAALDDAIEQEYQGNVAEALKSAKRAMDVADDVEDELKDPREKSTLRQGYTGLGEAVARLSPTPGQVHIKYRFTDLSPEYQTVINNMLDQLREKLDTDEYNRATDDLRRYMSGSDVADSDEILGWLSKVMRYLLA